MHFEATKREVKLSFTRGSVVQTFTVFSTNRQPLCEIADLFSKYEKGSLVIDVLDTIDRLSNSVFRDHIDRAKAKVKEIKID